MSELPNPFLSRLLPRPKLTRPEQNSACRFVLDETKFLADLMKEQSAVSGHPANSA
jgi:hypothetical protein